MKDFNCLFLHSLLLLLLLLEIAANVKCLKFIVFIFLPFYLPLLSLTVDTIMSTVINS